MEAALKNTEITDIEYLNDSFTINTSTEKNTIKFEELLDIEKKEIESDTELSGLGALLGTAVGISLGDFTGAFVGAPLGAFLGGLLGKKNLFFFNF